MTKLLSSYRSRLKSGRIKRGRFHTLVRYGLLKMDDNLSLCNWARVTAAEPAAFGVGTGSLDRLIAGAAADDDKRHFDGSRRGFGVCCSADCPERNAQNLQSTDQADAQHHALTS